MKRLAKIEAILSKAVKRPDGTLFEHEAYELFDVMGISTPARYFYNIGKKNVVLPENLTSKRLVAKAVVRGLTHKVGAGAVVFDVSSKNAAKVAANLLKKFSSDLKGVLFVEEIEYSKQPGNELLIGMCQDVFFGPCLALGFGGTAIEYYREIMAAGNAQVLIPLDLDIETIGRIISDLPVVKFLGGLVRGFPQQLEPKSLLSVIESIRDIGRRYSPQNPDAPFVVKELEINPAVAKDGNLMALDGVMFLCKKERFVEHHVPIKKIEKLLSPKSVAIAGVSGKNLQNPSNTILNKLLINGFIRENIYIIHPSEDKIEGFECVKNLSELARVRDNKPVDCLIVGVPAKVAGLITEEAISSGIAHSIEIISAGFSETIEGKAIQERIETKLAGFERSHELRPVINGPNTIGNIYRGTETLFTSPYKSSSNGKGRENCALICQSGAFMVTRMSDMAGILNPKIAISVGNQLDLSVADFLEWTLNEKGITAYGLYIEGLKPLDGARLVNLVKRARKLSKFVIIYKAGRTKEGIEAARGHTAAMAGDYGIFSYIMEKAGAMIAKTNQEFDALMMLSAYCGELFGSAVFLKDGPVGVAALSNAGFEKCAIADHLLDIAPTAARLAEYTPRTQSRIETIFRERRMKGVVDVHKVLDLSPIMDDAGFDEVIRATLEDKNTQFGIYSFVPETVALNVCPAGKGHNEDMMRADSLLNRMISIRRDYKKPFVMSVESGAKYGPFREKLFEAGIPCFDSVDTAARTVATLINEMVKNAFFTISINSLADRRKSGYGSFRG